ncbi:MAG: 50S ribosomal protein L25 [Actinomycetota bacterium]|nr:50S ribosomal protein L25 [Actinomycetota bacterium]
MPQQSTSLSASRREPAGSRGARRLRRSGLVLGTVYGGGKEPVSFQVDARILRNALAHSGAVIDLQIDAGASEPVVLKERVRHPVSGETVHIDLLRVDLARPIQQPVALELTDVEESDVKLGGVLEHTVRELTVEAIPTAIPDVIRHSIAGLAVGSSVTLGEIVAPEGTAIIGDPELVVAAIRSSRGMAAEAGTEIELETELVGAEPADGSAASADTGEH